MSRKSIKKADVQYGLKTKSKLQPEWYKAGEVKIWTEEEISNYELSPKALTKLEECRTMSKDEIEKLDKHGELESRHTFNTIMRGFRDVN